MATVLDLVKHYQHAIEKYPNDEQKILKCIDKLFHLNVTVQHLQETGVGRTVNALRKEPGEVGQASRALVYKWKVMVAAEESDQEGDHRNDTTNYSGHINKGDSEDNESKPKNRHDQYEKSAKSNKSTKDDQKQEHINGDYSGTKRKYQSSEEEEPDNKKSKHSSSSDDRYKRKQIKHEPATSGSDTQDTDMSQTEDSESDVSQRSEENKKHKYKVKEEKKEYDKCSSSSKRFSENSHRSHKSDSASEKSHSSSDKHTKHKSESRISEMSSSTEKLSSTQKKSRSKDKESSSSNKKEKSSHKSLEKEKKKDESSSKHSSDAKKDNSSNTDKHKSQSEKHSDTSNKHSSSNQKIEKKKHKSSSDNDPSNDKHKSKERSSSSKHSSSSKERSRDKDTSTSKETDLSHKDNKKDSPDSSSKSKKKDKHAKDKKDVKDSERKDDKKKKHSSSSSKSTKSSSSKIKEDVSKKKQISNSEDSEDGIDCESGASFAEALGMISPAKPKKKSATTKDVHSPNTFTDLSPASLLAPTAKLTPLPPLEISALPEISPNYRPLPPPKLLPHFTDEDAMNHVISSKNQRTKVYSGNKVLGKIPTLYEMCVHILQEHIDALEYTGGVPYEILKPVVDKATPQQLFMLEHYNPYLMEDTDHLWQKFCEKHFRNKQRQELETWREMYMRCQEEQEYRLRSLTENIKIAQEAKKAPIKQTKMAYVDTIVKPPRNIARKQALHGTAHASSASPAARVASLASAPNVLRGGSVRPPTAAPVSTSTFSKPKKAPLMQKALQFMRGRKR